MIEEPRDRRAREDRGVSPVIGVVMMVGVTVVLAAVLGTFVLDLGNRTMASAPSASLAIQPEPAGDNVTIRHRGGDPLRVAEIRIQVRKTNDTTTSSARYDPGVTAGQLAVGGTARLTMGPGVDGVDWPAGGVLEFTNGADEFGRVEPGDTVTITVIHTPSQRVVFETSAAV